VTQAHPLQWPAHIPRTRSPQGDRFRVSLAQARDELYDELERIGATKVVISSNMKLNLNGQPSANQPRQTDEGVAVYFDRKGQELCVACDKWVSFAGNLRAIGKTIEALRGLERWGTSEMVDAAFTGYAALPSATSGESCWAVLGVRTGASQIEIEAAYRDQAKRHHPDRGGDDESFKRLQNAYQQVLQVAS
jgi:hypothetical protein